METILTCSHCGAKLKFKTAMLNVVKEVRCAKCRQAIPVTPDAADGKGEPAAAAPKAGPKGGGSPMIGFSCAKCGRKISVVRSLAGKKIKCPGCSEINAVPEESVEAPAADASGAPSSAAGKEAPAASPLSAAAMPPLRAPDPTDRVSAIEGQVRSLAEQVRQLQADLARERSEVAECAREIEKLRSNLSAGAQG